MLLYWWYLWFKWIGCSAPELLEFMIICPGFCLTFYRKCCWPTSFHVRFLACIFYSHILWICYLYPLRLLCLFYSKAVIILFLLCSSLLTSFKSDLELKIMINRMQCSCWASPVFACEVYVPLLPSLGSPDSSVGKGSTCNAGDPGSIPGLGRSAGEGIGYPLKYSWAFLVAQLVKNLPAMWETWVQSLG